MRKDNWTSHLNTLIVERKEEPFSWGYQDCCLFACDAIFTITGIDPAKNIRDTYTTKFGASSIVAEYGSLVGLVEAFTEKYYFPEIPVHKAGRGDIVLCDTDQGEALGVCIGRTFCFAGPKGLVFKLRGIKRAWRI